MHIFQGSQQIFINKKKRYGAGAELLKDLEGLSPKKKIYRLQLKILKILKKAWQQRQHMLAGGSKSYEGLVAQSAFPPRRILRGG